MDLPTIAEPAKFSDSAPEGAVWPRISLVTPVFNSGKYIEATIRSILAQAYPNLEYFIIDGGSTDNTLNVIRKYESQISGWVSEPDNGMYDALNKGFARTTGEVMGWISATDQLHIGGLAVAGSVVLPRGRPRTPRAAQAPFPGDRPSFSYLVSGGATSSPGP